MLPEPINETEVTLEELISLFIKAGQPKHVAQFEAQISKQTGMSVKLGDKYFKVKQERK